MYRSLSRLASKEWAVGSYLKQIRSKDGWSRAYSVIELQTEKKDQTAILEEGLRARKVSHKDTANAKNKIADSGIHPIIVEGAMFRQWCKAVAADTLKMSINVAEAKIKSKAGVIGRSDGGESELGMKLDSGYLSPHFVTDQRSQKCELEDPLVFIYDKKIYNTDVVDKLMDLALSKQRPLLIVAEDVGSDALGNLVLSKLSSGVKVCAVKAPGLGDSRKASLQNLANVTGGDIVSQNLETEYDNLEPDMFGTCKKVTISKGETFIFEGAGAKKPTTERTAEEEDIELVKMHSAESEFLIKYLLEEEAKLEKRQAEKLSISFKKWVPEIRKKRRRSSAKVTRGKQKA